MTEVRASEIECQLNGNEICQLSGNEIQSSGTEQELPISNAESVPNSLSITELSSNVESVPEVDAVTNAEPEPIFESKVEFEPKPESESSAISEPNPESEIPITDSETNVESENFPASESPKAKIETPGQNQKCGFITPKEGNCDKYGWPIGSKYCTEVQESTSNDTSLTEDAEAISDESKVNLKVKSPESPQVDEEILFKVTSSYVNKRANMKKTIINVEEVEGAITEGIHAGTHFPYFMSYLSQKIKFRLTITRSPDKKLKITIKFGGNSVDILTKIVCLWLCREDEDKDKIVCEGLTRNKDEILIFLAQKFREIEHIKDDPIVLFEEIKQLVPELRGKEGLRSEDKAFLSSYRDLDEKLSTLMAILYREGCNREGLNDETLAQFRDMYFSLQIKQGFTIKQYLWAFYYYNLIFAPHIYRDLEKMMQQYAVSKNITLPSTPALIFPAGGQTLFIINPFAKNKLSIPEDHALIEMGALSSDGFIPAEGEKFKKPTNPKRIAQRRRQANQRNRKADVRNNKGNLTNQKNPLNQRSLSSQRNRSNQRNNPRNQSNQRDNLNPRSAQNSRNPNLRSPNDQRSQPVQMSPANKRRQGNQGGPVNKKRPVNQDGLPIQGGPSIPGVAASQVNQSGQKKSANRRKPVGQRNNQPNQRNNQPNLRNNQPNPRNNQPNSRNNQPNQRNNQLTQRNIQQNQRTNQRNSRPRRRPNLRSREQNREHNFAMDMQRNVFSAPHIQDFLSLNLRNDEFMQHNDLRNQDFGRNQSFSNNPRSPSFSQSNPHNQSFSQGNHSHNSSFSQSNNPRSLFSQDFFDTPHNQNYSANNSMGHNFSQQDSLRMPARASDFFVSAQDFFSGPSNFSDRSSSMNRNRDDMQFSGFNTRMSFGNGMNTHNFSNSSPNKNWDNKSNRGKRKNFRDGWSTKRQKQET